MAMLDVDDEDQLSFKFMFQVLRCIGPTVIIVTARVLLRWKFIHIDPVFFQSFLRSCRVIDQPDCCCCCCDCCCGPAPWWSDVSGRSPPPRTPPPALERRAVMFIRLTWRSQSRFRRIVEKIALERCSAATTSSRSERMSTMSAASIATEVPEESAMPTDAATSEGESLIPSPTYDSSERFARGE